MTVTELASRSVISAAASTGNLCIFSSTGIDHAQTETQYTAFKFWISESEDHFKPELAQLLYPLFTHLYISLLVSGPPSHPPTPSAAAKFHIRHRATFLGNPEFKLFIGQLGEAGTAEDLEQSPTIVSFRSAKYSVTLTERTYKYLLRYLETSESGLLLQILNQEVDIVIGDPLGSGSRQEMRQGAVETGQLDNIKNGESDQEMGRLQEIFRTVREGPGPVPSVALYRLQSDDGLVASAEADERGELLGLGCGDSQVRLVSTQPGGWEEPQEIGGASVRLGCDKGPRGHSLAGEEGQARPLRGHSGPVYGLDWMKGGGLLSCSEDTTVRYWDRASGAGLAVYRGHNYPVWRVRSDDLGIKFVTCSMDKTARLWQPEFNHPLRVYSGHDGSVDCVSWHPNCNYILTGSLDKTVRMWSYTDAQCVRLFPAGKAGITAVAFSHDGKLAASAGEDRRVRVWDLAEGSQLREFRGHTAEIVSLVWAQDSRMVISGAGDGAIRVWDTATGATKGDIADTGTVAQFSCGPNTSVVGASFTDTNILLVTAVETL